MSLSIKLLSASLLAGAFAHGEVELLHGAGTSNPSKLFWQAMSLITERSRLPLLMTYRKVGSSTGQKEFVGDTNGYKALNHFGAGDIPMTASRYASVTSNGREMIHVPFAMGGIGVFHHVPESNLGDNGELDLTPCLLARIFSRDITTWDHPDIVAINPGMTYSGDIKVVHRILGSSSTAGFTEYLAGSCAASWTLGSGSTITWPEGTFEAQASDGMSDFIQDNEGAIGYIDAGHGHSAGLGEVALQNRDGFYLTTRTADIGAAGSIALSASPSVIPASAGADFSAVNLYDLAGETTWPITMISYFYLDRNLTAMDPVSAGLLVYFVNFILSEEGQALAEDNMFVRLPETLINYNAVAMGTLITPTGMPTFSTESSTLPQVGAGQYVISKKRESWMNVITEKNTGAIAGLTAAEPSRAGATRLGQALRDYETRDLAIAGLVFGAIGFLLGVLAVFMALVLCCKSNRQAKPRSVEIPARDLTTPGAKADAV